MILDWLAKHWPWALAIFLVIVGLAVLVTVTSEHPVSALVLDVFQSWSPALSAAAVVILAIAAFAEIRESRLARAKDEKIKALERIEAWASGISQALSQTTVPDDPRLEGRLLFFLQRTPTVGADAMYFDQDLRDATKEAMGSLAKYLGKLQQRTNFEEIAGLATELAGKLYRLIQLCSVKRLALSG